MTPEARLLFALARVERLIEDDVWPLYALQQIARLMAVDGAELALLWQSKRDACAAARAALAGDPEEG